MAAKISLVLLAMVLQGGFHFALWCMALLALLAAANRQYLRVAAGSISLTGTLCAFRFVPAALTYTGNARRRFISGFTNLADLLAGLALPRSFDYRPEGLPTSIGWWEYDTFVGVAGLVFIGWFGIFRCARPGSEPVCRYRDLHVPLLVMAGLSLSWFYWPIFNLPLPLAAERVSTRFLTLPLVTAIVLGSIRFDGWQAYARPAWVRGLLAAGAAQTAAELAGHTLLWRMTAMVLRSIPNATY